MFAYDRAIVIIKGMKIPKIINQKEFLSSFFDLNLIMILSSNIKMIINKIEKIIAIDSPGKFFVGNSVNTIILLVFGDFKINVIRMFIVIEVVIGK